LTGLKELNPPIQLFLGNDSKRVVPVLDYADPAILAEIDQTHHVTQVHRDIRRFIHLKNSAERLDVIVDYGDTQITRLIALLNVPQRRDFIPCKKLNSPGIVNIVVEEDDQIARLVL
jgi:hypothetical protein